MTSTCLPPGKLRERQSLKHPTANLWAITKMNTLPFCYSSLPLSPFYYKSSLVNDKCITESIGAV